MEGVLARVLPEASYSVYSLKPLHWTDGAKKEIVQNSEKFLYAFLSR